MNTIYIALVLATVLVVGVILFFVLKKHKDSNSTAISRRERLSITPKLVLTTTYGEAPPTDNYYTYQYYKLPICY